MKRTFANLLPIVAVAAVSLISGGCDNSGGGLKGTTPSAEKTSFDQVAAKLDPGGNLYVYLSTEQVLEGLSGHVAAWKGMVSSIPDLDISQGDVDRIFGVVTKLISDSGIEDVSGFGMSGIATEPGFYRTKSVLHHYPGKGDGFLWKIGGAKAHPLKALDMLPANTAFAVFSDLDVQLIWSVIEKHARESGFPQVNQVLQQLPTEFKNRTGMDWNAMMKSFGGEFGFVITLDEARMVTIPLPTSTKFEVPEPGLLLAIKVNDDTLFNRVEQALSQSGMQVKAAEESGLKMRTVLVPVPVPIQIRPTLAAGDGYLFIASSDTLMQQFMAVKAGKSPGIKSTDEFKRLSKGIPEEGNEFCYLSERFGRTIMQVQKQALEIVASQGGERASFLRQLLTAGPSAYAYSVTANTDEGWISVGNGNQHPARMMTGFAILPAIALVSGMTLPALAKARQRAQNVTCINNLRQIDAAKHQWALEKSKGADARPGSQELSEYLPGGFPTCPQGGHYTIGTVDEKATCSIPGHSL